MNPIICKLVSFISLFAIVITSHAQVKKEPLPGSQTGKPYRLLTQGRQITIKSNTYIKHVMLWTTGGNRVVEQKEINKQSFAVDIPVNQKNFFLMIGMSNGKIYTEKIGIQ